MKKIILSMIGLLAATAFAPQASAVPAFARQTGMACNACHQQHFPILNSFGRAFKADGFTMVGSQPLIEDEHMSLPSVLNTGILLKAQYRITNGDVKVRPDGNTSNDGRWMVPDEFGLFFGGRLADTGALKVGTMIEHDMDNLVGFRIPVVADLGGVKLSAIPFLTDALGPWYGYTESSTGLNRAVRWNEHHADISAHRFVGAATGSASGVSLLVKADIGYLNYTMWTPNFPMTDQSLALSMVHAAWTPTFGAWDMVVGVDVISGTDKVADPVVAGTPAGFEINQTTGTIVPVAATPASGTGTFVDGADYKMTGLTVQAHGAFGEMPAGIYATYAVAPKSTVDSTNAYNGNANDESAFTIGADVSVIPHALHVGAAYRAGTTGAVDAAGDDVTDNALTVAMTYDLAQNLALQVTHSMYSGTKYDKVQAAGDAQTSILLETAW
ncbi:MAG TPA: hypothetical protein VGD24_01760 [Gallionella sp.]